MDVRYTAEPIPGTNAYRGVVWIDGTAHTCEHRHAGGHSSARACAGLRRVVELASESTPPLRAMTSQPFTFRLMGDLAQWNTLLEKHGDRISVFTSAHPRYPESPYVVEATERATGEPRSWEYAGSSRLQLEACVARWLLAEEDPGGAVSTSLELTILT